MRLQDYALVTLTFMAISAVARSEDCAFKVNDGCICFVNQSLVTINCTAVNISSPLITSNVSDPIQLHLLCLRNKNLAQIPDNFFKDISHIQHFDFSFNSFTMYPTVLNKLNISMIDLSHNSFTSLDLSSTVPMYQVQTLDLSHNHIAKVEKSEVSSFPVSVLKLSNNRLTDIPDIIWKSVTDLDLSFNLISSLSTLPKSSLRYLTLSGNLLDTVPAMLFSQLSSLDKLNLDQNKIKNLTAANFKGLSALTELSLADNRLVELSGSCFKELTNLIKMNLERNQITKLEKDSFLGLGDDLQWLSVHENMMSRIATSAFKNLKNLRHLDISDNPNLSDINKIDFPPHLVFLDISNCSLSEIEDCKFVLYMDLQFLSLSDNKLKCSCHLSWLYRWQKYMRMDVYMSTNTPPPNWKCLDSNQKLQEVSSDLSKCNASQHLKHCNPNGILFPNPDLIDLKMSVIAQDEVITATWTMKPKDNIHGFVVTYNTMDNTKFESPLLESSVTSYVIKDMKVEGSYTVCVHALLNETFTLKKTCFEENTNLLQMIVGVMAGIVFLVPCIIAMTYILYKDHQVMKEVEYEWIPDIEQLGNDSKSPTEIKEGQHKAEAVVPVNGKALPTVVVKSEDKTPDTSSKASLEVHVYQQVNASYVSDCGHTHVDDNTREDECAKTDKDETVNTKL